jgi:putative tryptophan/tyrosine transport system substrate-binding protein
MRALTTFPDTLTEVYRAPIISPVARAGLPAVYDTSLFVDAGGLMAYGASLPDLYRRTAAYVDKILKGASPGDLPVQHPVQFEFVINLKTAQALGLTIPQSVLMQATEIIQ